MGEKEIWKEGRPKRERTRTIFSPTELYGLCCSFWSLSHTHVTTTALRKQFYSMIMDNFWSWTRARINPIESGPQIVWILTRDRIASQATVDTANEAFANNNVDVGSRWFKMTQSDTCVNDQSPSCSDDPANLKPVRPIQVIIDWFNGIFGGLFGW